MSLFLNQTELSKHFYVPSFFIGKKLIKMGFKDENTKLASKILIEKNMAKNISFNNNTFSIWDHKIISLIEKDIKSDFDFCAHIIVGIFRKIKNTQKKDDGSRIYQSYYEKYEENLNRFLFVMDENIEIIHEKISILARKKGVLKDYLFFKERNISNQLLTSILNQNNS